MSHTSTSFNQFEEIHNTGELVAVLQSVFTWWLYTELPSTNGRKKYIVKWRRWCLRTTVLRLFDCDEKGSGINYYFVIYYKNLGDRVYKTAAATVIDGYTDAVVTRRLCGGVARAGINVYRIKTYGQQVEDQHVWYLSRCFIWILTHTCEY